MQWVICWVYTTNILYNIVVLKLFLLKLVPLVYKLYQRLLGRTGADASKVRALEVAPGLGP